MTPNEVHQVAQQVAHEARPKRIIFGAPPPAPKPMAALRAALETAGTLAHGAMGHNKGAYRVDVGMYSVEVRRRA